MAAAVQLAQDSDVLSCKQHMLHVVLPDQHDHDYELHPRLHNICCFVRYCCTILYAVITPPLIGERSILMREYVCLSSAESTTSRQIVLLPRRQQRGQSMQSMTALLFSYILSTVYHQTNMNK